MVKWPTFLEFKKRLIDEFDCKYELLPVGLRGFRRKTYGEERSQVLDMHDEEIVRPAVIRSTCERLHIDPTDFHLILGYPPPGAFS